MNWLHTYGAQIDCKDLKAILKDEKGRKVCFCRQREAKSCYLISAMKANMKANRLLCQGCIGYWCYAIEPKQK